MSRFAVVYEDPTYEEPEDIMDWLDNEIDGAPVVKKPQIGFVKGQEFTIWSAGAGVGKTQLG